MSQEIITRASQIIIENSVFGGEYRGQHCVLALIDLESHPTASTITPSKSQGIEWVTFCTGLESDKAKRIEKCNRASLCFSSSEHNISLVGEIEVITDPDIKKEMWYDSMSAHFSGPDAPGYCALKFTTKRYNLLVDWKEAVGVL